MNQTQYTVQALARLINRGSCRSSANVAQAYEFVSQSPDLARTNTMRHKHHGASFACFLLCANETLDSLKLGGSRPENQQYRRHACSDLRVQLAKQCEPRCRQSDPGAIVMSQDIEAHLTTSRTSPWLDSRW